MSKQVVTRIALSLLLVLNGCSAVSRSKSAAPQMPAVVGRTLPFGPLAPDEQQSVANGEKSIVLMRLNVTWNGRPLKSPAEYLEFGLGSIYTSGLVPIAPRVISEQAREDGWLVLVLHPGTYNFWVLPPYGQPKSDRFTLEVSARVGVIYAGSITIACSSDITQGHAPSCSAPVLAEQPGEAGDFVRTSLPDLGSPKTQLLEPYRPPGNSIAVDLFPMAILARSHSEPTPPTVAPYT